MRATGLTRLTRLTGLIGILSALPALAAEPPAFVWLEGEAPTKVSGLKPNMAGWGRKEFLSEEKWLHISMDPAAVEKDLPAEGGLLEYAFAAPKDAAYEVWTRIGFEFVRSPFEWRIDGGDWATAKPTDLTTDCMEIDFWCEVAWLKVGEKQLARGDHKLEIRLPRTKDDKGKTARILFALDAICLTAGEFSPNSHFKPGEESNTAQDQEAAKTVFDLPEPKAPDARSSVALKGLWQVCRHDEQLPKEVAAPIADLPKTPHWKAIEVPGDKNTLRPDLLFAHRLWYRTRIRVPDSLAGRSFFVVFPENNLNTTVLVNGVLCGFDKNPFARVQIDVTKGMKPGVNELWVGIRDAWYGRSTNPNDPMKLRKTFNIPLSFFHQGFQDLAYPIWNHAQSGILVTPELVAAGPAYASDVFCKPSVAKKELALEVTVNNPTGKELTGEVVCQAVNAKTGEAEKSFAPKPFTLAPGASQTLAIAEPWANPKLWWPDEPNLYLLRTSVSVRGKSVDVSDTRFGFREWGWQGRDFTLNGIPWHLWCDCFTAGTKEQWLEFYRKTNQRMMRFWGTRWQGMPHREALDFFDENGVVVRRSGILDGEAIGYFAIERDPDLKKLYNSEIKMQLMENWRDQVVAQVKGERNHPSVMIWSIENEWLYINCINLHGGHMDEFEREVKRVADAVMAADPTRPVMNDGGGAHKNNQMPVAGDHYVTGPYHEYPALAYDANTKGGGRGRWEWDLKRPRFIGEDFFITGNNPEFAYFGGEEAFQGKIATRPAASLMARMLMEGYRWSNQCAWHFWMGQNDAPGQYASYPPRAVFCRQWDWTFGSGQKVKRTFGIFNDTRFDDPISFTWALALDGKNIAGKTTEHKLAAGTCEKFDVEIDMPAVTARQEGELTLSLSVKGQEVFKDTKAVSVLGKPAAVARLDAKNLLVFDPQGGTAAFLKANGVAFTPLADLKALPETGKVLLLGKDALDAAESTSSRLAAWALGGRRLIALEQKNPLKFQALPCEMEAQTNRGTTAFAEDLNHPALRGLAQKDFFTWGGDELVYRDAYAKPTRGAKSLIQCHTLLQSTGLAEVPVGEGLMLLCQLLVGEKLADNAVAQLLLVNLLDYAATYKLEFRQVVACATDPTLAKTLDEIGLQHVKASTPLEALGGAARVAIVSASPAHLKALADNAAKVKAFTDAGGWLLLHGLTPEGLADYNKLVGFDHMIRPFRRERVGLTPVRNPLMAGLTLNDIVMYSSERIFPWTQGNYVANDTFSFVVDYEDVAPFAKFEDQYDSEHPDRNPSNLVNGMVSADAWKYIVNRQAPAAGPLDFPLAFPKEVELVELEWIGNTFYWPVTKVQLVPDGADARAATFVTQPTNEPQTFPIDPPLRGRNITLRLAEWLKLPDKQAVTGLDNIRLKAKRPPEFYKAVKPMLNIGAMMEYPRGSGGIVLCNLLLKDREDVPANYAKKRNILTTLLRNLKAPFAGGKAIIAGANLHYTPIDLSKHANQFTGEQGCFGDKRLTLKDLPTGRQVLAGAPYDIFEFRTSPVPTILMLGGRGIPGNLKEEIRGVPIGRKADALFFLMAARLDQRMNPNDIKQKKRYEMARYVVTYADGKTEEIPLIAEMDLDDYRQKEPKAIPGAQIAWVKPYDGTDLSAVLYSKQWNNPRPDVEIKSLDLLYGPDRRGVPALIALTAATGR
ncbi:MAG TPA: glycoside hydrolase family 2 TIM barrel-domain containing protein [Planctomycetota bacterium]|nr:glycoside hydrolase family 2 TIM barrel-domain containing protein [Planctomycetota bacterium]